MLRKEKQEESLCLIPQSGEVASEQGDRLQVTHVATETVAACIDESPISVLL